MKILFVFRCSALASTLASTLLGLFACCALLGGVVAVSVQRWRRRVYTGVTWKPCASHETKRFLPGKIVPSKCCLPSWNISLKKDFDTDVLFNERCHTFSATFCNVYWIWTLCQQTTYLIDKAILGKMGGVYVTYVADVDKGQWHVVTLVRSFKVTECAKLIKVIP